MIKKVYTDVEFSEEFWLKVWFTFYETEVEKFQWHKHQKTLGYILLLVSKGSFMSLAHTVISISFNTYLWEWHLDLKNL